MKLHFDLSACVRAKSKFSECRKCLDVCPDVISLSEEGMPTFQKATGVEAAACVGVCPAEAFSLSTFSTTEFFFTFLESKVRLISPKFNVPCLSVLSVEHLISLALASAEPVTLDVSAYDANSTLFAYIVTTIEEANFILSSFSEKRLESNFDTEGIETPEVSKEKEQTSTSRRSFLENASLRGVLKHKKALDEAVEEELFLTFDIDDEMIAKMKDKQLPDKRKILLTTLKHAGIPEEFEILPEEEVGFISQKYIDETCTNCQICYRICPTGALSSDGKFSLIQFDAMLCLKCHLCHDVCEPDAIHLQKGFEVKEFFEPTQRTLAHFTIKRCNECGNHFTYTGGEQMCPRCSVEEEEARFLHESAKKMKVLREERMQESENMQGDQT